MWIKIAIDKDKNSKRLNKSSTKISQIKFSGEVRMMKALKNKQAFNHFHHMVRNTKKSGTSF